MRTVDVLIVGAGPAGLAAACRLTQEGQRVLIVDMAPAGTNTSRAAVVHARTLEVLEQIGLASVLVENGIAVPEFTMRDGTSTLARLDFSSLPTHYPFTLMIPQSRTEQLLEARLRELGGEVERGVELQRLHLIDERYRAIVSRDGAEPEEIEPRFIIGADGAHSRVRSEAGITFDGSEYQESFILADITMRWPLPQREVQLFLSTDGLVVVAPLPSGHHRVVATIDKAPRRPTLSDVQHILDTRGPGNTTVEAVSWSSRFRVAHRLASHYRSHNVFLVGDAAHVHSPAGGQGMNVGIQDALDLAESLTRALKGETSAEDLARYEQRRRPAAVAVISLTDRMTRLATLHGSVPRRTRNAILRTLMRSRRVRTALATRIAQI
jgi:2-polyprenyl-6-methoxyphenol hydroxylase-like FAD-dependent oxidoreductase